MPDGPRVGGVTPFLKVAGLAHHAGLMLAPHFAMELHVHLAAAYPTEPWVEHFEWLELAVQRAHRDRERPHARAHPPGPGPVAERAGARLDA